MKDRFDRLWDNKKLSSLNSNSQIIAARFFGTIRWAEERSKGGKDFSQEEISFFEALAEMGTLAIENARMYEPLRKDYENLMHDIFMFVGYRRSI